MSFTENPIIWKKLERAVGFTSRPLFPSDNPAGPCRNNYSGPTDLLRGNFTKFRPRHCG
ncbi:uncharacterized protein BDW47DRAFT_102789 [Aspergillus candidus]|uniref:Uncharacterized protein n=1 Tax=Aspergillus candidus TaxID=41067 RepID=A0A2I2FG54_ASPCN|nr:hypothetical protein BDW47DRAFT_102789 [Aspergillus candidus]PLB39607.1 hypothetical protein BDW47DRAFT_102789 [Aspergillus candidus]